jgi:HlyD family secretion protein
MHPNPRKILPVILLLAIAGGLIWYFTSQRASAENSVLSASGTIEATQVILAPELSGRLREVLADQGDSVQVGQVLVKLDDSLLQAQLAQAQATLAQAQANYDLVASGPPPEQRQAAITGAKAELTSAQQALDDLYTNHELQRSQVRQQIATTDKALDKARQNVDSLNTGAEQTDIDAAWDSVVLAQDHLDKAKDKFEPYQGKPVDNLTRALFQSQLVTAQKQYDNAVTRYNNLVGSANKYDLAVAETNVTLLEAQLADARRRYDDMQEGPDPETLRLAQARLEAAKAGLASAEAGPSEQQLALARAQVQVAQAAVKALQTQIDKLTIKSPTDGVVISRAVEPGEVAVAGSPLLTLGRLADLKLTVFIPEDRYGSISLGQQVSVTVDSFPGEKFQAKVDRIADKAEFTPRNVQTETGRRTTVFAVELAVQNPEGKLKPGMPADVTFGS